MKKALSLAILTTIISCSVQAKDCWDEYTAKYKFPEGSLFKEVNIVLKDGSLLFNSSVGSIVLQKDGVDRFIIPIYNGTATFKRNSANEIIGIKIEALGLTSTGSIEKKSASKAVSETKIPSKVLLPKWFDQPDDIYTY